MKTRPPRVARCLAVSVEACEPRRLFAAQAHAELEFTVNGLLADRTRDLVYVADASAAAIRVIDTQAATQVAQIPLADTPYAMALSIDGASLFVALSDVGKVQVISTNGFASQRVMNVGAAISRLAVGAGDTLYGGVVDPQGEQYGTGLVQFNALTGARGATLRALDSSDTLLRADAAGRRLYLPDHDQFVELNIESPAGVSVVRTYADGEHEYGGFLPDTAAGRLYTLDASDSTLGYFRTDTGVATEWGGSVADEATGRATDVAGRPGDAGVWVAYKTGYRGSSTLRQFAAANGATLASYDVAEGTIDGPDRLAVTPNGRVLYAATTQPGTFEDDAYAGLGIIGAATLTLPDADPVVTGTLFNDRNGNGARDAGEDWFGPGVDADGNGLAQPEVRVYLDLNGNGTWDESRQGVRAEPSDVLRAAGPYRLALPATGAYTVRVVQSDTGPGYDLPIYGASAGGRAATVWAGGQQLLGVDMPLVAGFRVDGFVFADFNGNGAREPDEAVIEDEVVFLDANYDGVAQAGEPQGDSYGVYYADSTANYDLAAAPGAGVVRLLNPHGYRLTTPAYANVAGAGEQTYHVGFGVVPNMTLSGTLYDDRNANGTRDAGEPARAGVRAWLDADGDGKYDKGERNGISDANGHYAIAALRPDASHVVRFRVDGGQRLFSSAAVQHVAFDHWADAHVVDFGLFAPADVTVNVYFDKAANHKFSKGDHALAGVIVFIDADRDGRQDGNERSASTDALGNVTFDALPPGTYAINVRIGRPRRATTPATFDVALAEGQAASYRVGAR